jgi:acetylornithine/succinyldiaminopimelate/putrescine aminotransferase
MGGFSGTLIHQGVPASKARNLECLVRGGGFMIAVHTSTMREAHHIANIFVKEGAEYVVTADPMKQRVKMKPPPLSAHHSH